MGLAQGPDGALYVTESVKGKVWRITYKGDRATFGPKQLQTMAARKSQQAHIRNPHETNDVIGKETFAAGAKIYETYCVSCHQRDAKGDGARFPPLAATNWVSGNKQRLISVVVHGLSGEIEVEGTTLQRRDAAARLPERRSDRPGAHVPAAELRQLRAGRAEGRSGRGAHARAVDAAVTGTAPSGSAATPDAIDASDPTAAGDSPPPR